MLTSIAFLGLAQQTIPYDGPGVPMNASSGFSRAGFGAPASMAGVSASA